MYFVFSLFIVVCYFPVNICFYSETSLQWLAVFNWSSGHFLAGQAETSQSEWAAFILFDIQQSYFWWLYLAFWIKK